MKRTVTTALCLVLVIGLLCTLTACGEDISGRYELISATIDNRTLTIDEFKAFLGADTEMYLELNNDGTGTMAFVGQVAEMQWEGNQIWSAEGGVKADFTVEEGVLTLDLSGTVLVFKK